MEQPRAKGAGRLPGFAGERWYGDPNDPRCPHDAWLDGVTVREPATGARQERRLTEIEIRLLGAYHNGWITLTYRGVRSHALTCYQCDQGMGDWLRDEFEVTEEGLIRHRITWWTPATSKAPNQWLIEAEEVTYAWTPKGA